VSSGQASQYHFITGSSFGDLQLQSPNQRLLWLFFFLHAEFNYDPSVHNVVAVDAGGYYGCRSSGTPYGSGSDRITLGPGTSYFICSLNGHCGMGMKMIVNAS
jgi:hypothetical protein